MRAGAHPPAVLQNRFHAETGYDRELREFCRARGIIYQSFWTLTANPHLLTHETVRALARQHGRTPAQILFRYLTQLGIVPLTGTARRRTCARTWRSSISNSPAMNVKPSTR